MVKITKIRLLTGKQKIKILTDFLFYVPETYEIIL